MRSRIALHVVVELLEVSVRLGQVRLDASYILWDFSLDFIPFVIV